jgi:methyltransferase of ATP-grasp peptide maturase system
MGQAVTPQLDALRADFMHQVDPERAVAPDWRAALAEVPRDLFVPSFFVPLTDRLGWRIVEHPDDEWAAGVLSDRPRITQLDGNDEAARAARRGEVVQGRATSSSSQPSLMVLMLEALNVHAGHWVLEVGTGSGYNAALLCHHVGHDRVVTLDVDPAVTDLARARLAAIGYRPRVVTADGVKGYPRHAPYDRIVATVAVSRLPQAWIEQTRDGGQILFPLDTRNGGGIMPLLTVHGDSAEGRFLPEFGGFMPVREQQRRDLAQAAFREVTGEQGVERATALAAEVATDDVGPFEFFGALFTGGYDYMTFTPTAGGPTETWIAHADGSWVCHTTDTQGAHRVRQGGPQRLWDRIEELQRQWNDLGAPQRQRFGLTATPDAHTVWLDAPSSGRTWTLR